MVTGGSGGWGGLYFPQKFGIFASASTEKERGKREGGREGGREREGVICVKIPVQKLQLCITSLCVHN